MRGDKLHHGNTVFFRTKIADSPMSFPSVPWAVEVAKDYSDLGGQLRRSGVEDGLGPVVVPANYVPDRKMRKRMNMPNTHYWEYGQ